MKKQTKKAYSLIEVMIATFVLAVGIVAIVALLANSIKHSIDSRNQVIASKLAGEGIELVLNARDNKIVNEDSSDFMSSVCNGGGNPAIDPVTGANTNLEYCYAIIDVNTVDFDSSWYCDDSSTQGFGPITCNNTLYHDGSQYLHDSSFDPTPFKRIVSLWYAGGRSGETYTSANTCVMGVLSQVYWGNDSNPPGPCVLSNKCAETAVHLLVERNPGAPECGAI